jgi:hypothetical protein
MEPIQRYPGDSEEFNIDEDYVSYADHARAVQAERERCATIVENEPELDGHPERYQLEAMRDVGLVESLRAVVRATKKSIAAAIRQPMTVHNQPKEVRDTLPV